MGDYWLLCKRMIQKVKKFRAIGQPICSTTFILHFCSISMSLRGFINHIDTVESLSSPLNRHIRLPAL